CLPVLGPVRGAPVGLGEAAPVPPGPRTVGDTGVGDALSEAAAHRHGDPDRARGTPDVVAVLPASFTELHVVQQDQLVRVGQPGEVAGPRQVGRLVGDQYAAHQHAIR